MKLKKLLAFALAGVFALSMMTACGDSDEEYEEEESGYEDIADEEEVDLDAPVSEETWAVLMENAAAVKPYSEALKTMTDAPDELVAYVEEINPRVKEVAAMVKDGTTEGEALDANEDILSWIDTFSQYIDLE